MGHNQCGGHTAQRRLRSRKPRNSQGLGVSNVMEASEFSRNVILGAHGTLGILKQCASRFHLQTTGATTCCKLQHQIRSQPLTDRRYTRRCVVNYKGWAAFGGFKLAEVRKSSTAPRAQSTPAADLGWRRGGLLVSPIAPP